MTPPERRALLGTLVARAASPGSRTLVVGEPGAGRTHLLAQAVRGARAEGVAVLSATGLPDAVTVVEGALLAASPVCLAVDDWPLLDPESAAVVRELLDRSPRGGPGVSLLATARQDEVLTGLPDPVDGTLFAGTDVLPVPALSVGSLADVLTVTTGQRWTGAAAAGLHAATGGNPRWATELAGPQLAHLPGHVGPQLPGSVAAALGARLDALTDRAREALTVVAALGGADPECVLAVVPDHQGALAEARDARVLRWTGSRFEPAHPIVGTAALARLGHRRVEQLRRELYARLGRDCAPADVP